MVEAVYSKKDGANIEFDSEGGEDIPMELEVD